MSEVPVEDILYIDEEVDLFPPANLKIKWNVKPKCDPEKLAPGPSFSHQSGKPKRPPRLTPHTLPTLKQPALINNREVTNLKLLKPTTTLEELNKRKSNTYQRFPTRDGEDIYLEQRVINRIKFEEIQQKKGREHTVNLPERFQVRIKVKLNGDIIFHHYHKRGISKYKKISVEPCCSTEEENVQNRT